MAILPQIQERDASEHVHEVYDQVKSRYGGFLPDIYKAFANDPEYLASINDHMARVLKPRKVDAKTKEVIALVVGGDQQLRLLPPCPCREPARPVRVRRRGSRRNPRDDRAVVGGDAVQHRRRRPLAAARRRHGQRRGGGLDPQPRAAGRLAASWRPATLGRADQPRRRPARRALQRPAPFRVSGLLPHALRGQREWPAVQPDGRRLHPSVRSRP